jgi:predicted nucleotidyltransferase
MHTVESIKELLATHLETLHQYGVSNLWLFGSAARGESYAKDLDFIVEFKQPPGLMDYMGLKFFLEEIFSMHVDLHSKVACPERFYKRIEADLKHVA